MSETPTQKILTEKECEDVMSHIQSISSPGGERTVMLGSIWQNSMRWARNKASMSSGRQINSLWVVCRIDGQRGYAITNQLDEKSVEDTVRQAEANTRVRTSNAGLEMTVPYRNPPMSHATTWSAATADRDAVQNAALVKEITSMASLESLVSSGYMETGLMASALLGQSSFTSEPYYFYGTQSVGQCSTTIRSASGQGSGWAGMSSFDLNRINEIELARTALDKCMKSLDPVRIEPGRYTVILEPQAVSDLLDIMLDSQGMSRMEAERSSGPFAIPGYDRGIGRYRSKLGLKIVDERITISHDPSDPALGVFTIPGMQPVTWIKNGVLTALPHSADAATNERLAIHGDEWRVSFRMDGGTSSVEDMISSADRALLVTRLTSITTFDDLSLISTGLTRDGLWLIEDGKISRAVRNFRWTESPLFVLNNVVDIGRPVQVFRPKYGMEGTVVAPQYTLATAMVPPIMARDFSFTSTIDAV